MRRYWWGVGTGVFAMMVLPLLVIASGLIDMGATTEPGTLEKNLAALTIQSSMAWRAPDKPNPMVDDEEAISNGLKSFGQMCARCHGGPGIEPSAFAKGLNPRAPRLDHAGEEFTGGELFWITKHGIRMTGMPAFGPTHEDKDIWEIVAFVQHLPRLSEAQKEELKRVAPSQHQHESGNHPESHGNNSSGQGDSEHGEHRTDHDKSSGSQNHESEHDEAGHTSS